MLMNPFFEFLCIGDGRLVAARIGSRMMHDESDAVRFHPGMPYKRMMALPQIAEGALDNKFEQMLVFDLVFVRKRGIPVQLRHHHA
ncbi:hypothetical protein D3C76_1064190 [compost metagenome]